MVGLVDARIDRASIGAELRWTGLLAEFHQELAVSGCRIRAHRTVEQRCWTRPCELSSVVLVILLDFGWSWHGFS